MLAKHGTNRPGLAEPAAVFCHFGGTDGILTLISTSPDCSRDQKLCLKPFDLIFDYVDRETRGDQTRLTPFKLDKVNLDECLPDMTREEEKHADQVMKLFREEDRVL